MGEVNTEQVNEAVERLFSRIFAIGPFAKRVGENPPQELFAEFQASIEPVKEALAQVRELLDRAHEVVYVANPSARRIRIGGAIVTGGSWLVVLRDYADLLSEEENAHDLGFEAVEQQVHDLRAFVADDLLTLNAGSRAAPEPGPRESVPPLIRVTLDSQGHSAKRSDMAETIRLGAAQLAILRFLGHRPGRRFNQVSLSRKLALAGFPVSDIPGAVSRIRKTPLRDVILDGGRGDTGGYEWSPAYELDSEEP